MKVLPKPARVDMATIKGKVIAHRFDKESWALVWALDGKAQRFANSWYEVKYKGFRELYLHRLSKTEYGADKTWVMYG